MSDEQAHTVYAVCAAADPSKCDHEHVTLHDFDPLLGTLTDAIEKHGIKRGGIRYVEERG